MYQYFGQLVEKIEEILDTEDNIVSNTPRPIKQDSHKTTRNDFEKMPTLSTPQKNSCILLMTLVSFRGRANYTNLSYWELLAFKSWQFAIRASD